MKKDMTWNECGEAVAARGSPAFSDLEHALDRVRRARERVRKGWTQHALARDGTGFPVTCDSPRAAAWCISGALHTDIENEGLVLALYMALVVVANRSEWFLRSRGSFVTLNDHPSFTQAEALTFLEEVEKLLVSKVEEAA